MAEYDNTNSGVLFKNKQRDKDSQPHMGGTIDIEGKSYRLAAWSNEHPKHGKYLKLKVSEFQKKDGDFEQKETVAVAVEEEPF